MDTSENAADVFTKSLPPDVYRKHLNTASNVAWRGQARRAARRPRIHCPLHESCKRSIILALGVSQ
eukprot:1018736-Pleurochrysis_carterae.AAC.1